MNITSTVATTKANETTPRGYFELEYSLENNLLTRFQLTAYTSSSRQEYIGYITCEGGNIISALKEGSAYGELYADFERLLLAIREQTSTEQTSSQSETSK